LIQAGVNRKTSRVEQDIIKISFLTFRDCDPMWACANCSGQPSPQHNFRIWCQVAHVFGEDWVQIITCNASEDWTAKDEYRGHVVQLCVNGVKHLYGS
jgi:hypothetical protein